MATASAFKKLRLERASQESKPLWYVDGRCFTIQERPKLDPKTRSRCFYYDVMLPLDNNVCNSAHHTQFPTSDKPSLVLDVEHTLACSITVEGSLLVGKRPCVDEFLSTISKHYELILWASSAEEALVADHVLGKVFSHRISDLSLLDRSLDRLVLVTTKQDSSFLGNKICIPKYLPDGRHEDVSQLRFLEKVLIDLASPDLNDHFKCLRRQGVLQSLQLGKEQSYKLNVQQQQQQLMVDAPVGMIKLEVLLHTPWTQPSEPYLPPGSGKPTLVVDLDETLVSSTRVFTNEIKTVHHVSKRPGVDAFLSEVAKVYEVVLWTASWQQYADEVVDNVLDPGRKFISHRLYEQHLINTKKDLCKLGRPLESVVVVDDTESRYKDEHKEKVIVVPQYLASESKNDEELLEVLQKLRNLNV